MRMIVTLLLTIVTRGVIDYSSGCNRPWVVDSRNPRRYPGRGKTLLQAFKNHYGQTK